LRRCLTY